METIRLGKTNLTVTKNGFGALPVQRVDKDYAVKLLRRAYAADKLRTDEMKHRFQWNRKEKDGFSHV